MTVSPMYPCVVSSGSGTRMAGHGRKQPSPLWAAHPSLQRALIVRLRAAHPGRHQGGAIGCCPDAPAPCGGSPVAVTLPKVTDTSPYRAARSICTGPSARHAIRSYRPGRPARCALLGRHRVIGVAVPIAADGVPQVATGRSRGHGTKPSLVSVVYRQGIRKCHAPAHPRTYRAAPCPCCRARPGAHFRCHHL